MKAGDVALTPLPQADGQIKNQPVVILREMPLFGDIATLPSNPPKAANPKNQQSDFSNQQFSP